MTILEYVLLGLAAWILVAVVLGYIVGKIIAARS